ncbi:MAG: hypothetical protein ACRC4M_05355 [Mycoplasma sp.]
MYSKDKSYNQKYKDNYKRYNDKDIYRIARNLALEEQREDNEIARDQKILGYRKLKPVTDKKYEADYLRSVQEYNWRTTMHDHVDRTLKNGVQSAYKYQESYVYWQNKDDALSLQPSDTRIHKAKHREKYLDYADKKFQKQKMRRKSPEEI